MLNINLLPLLFLVVILVSQKVTKAESYLHILGSNNDSIITSTSESAAIGRNCTNFQGQWVFDTFYPLYNSSSCPFIDREFDCQTRPNKLPEKYRWQPFGCILPRFDGMDFLRKYKGKKIMFVGDSLSLNQFESLACMIHSRVPNANTSYLAQGVSRSLTFQEFNLTLMIYRSPYLVDLVNEKVGRVLKLDSINGTAWEGKDVLIFNSWHWWPNKGKTQPWDFMQEGNKLYRDMDRLTAYHKGLTTWANWVNLNVKPAKTKVFFVGISPTHYLGSDWNVPEKTCTGETKPFTGKRYPGATPQARAVVEKVIKKPVQWLDITLLSQYRIDAHPSIYSNRGTDCSHWCLPGLPDTWNQLLYAALL